MLKGKDLLAEMNPEDTDIFVADIHTKYANRAPEYENLCLAEYAAEYNEKRENGQITLIGRNKTKLIRFTHYAEKKDPFNYYREQCLLYLRWRNEREEIELMDC